MTSNFKEQRSTLQAFIAALTSAILTMKRQVLESEVMKEKMQTIDNKTLDLNSNTSTVESPQKYNIFIQEIKIKVNQNNEEKMKANNVNVKVRLLLEKKDKVVMSLFKAVKAEQRLKSERKEWSSFYSNSTEFSE
jgi:hypothetical protein